MLHILNGDGTANPFWQARLPGEVMVWREVLSEGPADYRQRFPSLLNGVNKIETTLLQILAKGPAATITLLEAFWQQEPLFGLGDTQILHYLAPLTEAGLVSRGESWALTNLGHAVLDNRYNFGDLYPLHRWLGGVYLAPAQPRWRWDPDNDQLQPA